MNVFYVSSFTIFKKEKIYLVQKQQETKRNVRKVKERTKNVLVFGLNQNFFFATCRAGNAEHIHVSSNLNLSLKTHKNR